MYWIEVDFENGKTLRKESENINGSYKVWARYSNSNSRPRVQRITAGYDDTLTLNFDKLNNVVN